MLKKWLSAAAVAAALAMFATPMSANAQALGVKCQALSESPYMCVKNASNWPITSIQATAGWAGGGWIPMPGGTLMPGETVIVKFPTFVGGCIQNVYVRDMTGQQHPFWKLDVCRTPGLIIRS